MSARFRAFLPDSSRRDPDWNSYVRPASESFLPRPAENLWLLQAGLALILVIVCANAASLQAVRSNARRKEFAIRAALGAGRRLFRQVVYEALILGCSGGLLGMLIASWSLRVVQSRLPDLIERSLRGADPLQLDFRVAAFATAITIGASVIFGVIPVIPALRVDIIASLRTNAKGDTVESYRRGGFIVAGEIGLAVALLTGAGITVKSMIAIERHNLGFNSDHVVSAIVELPSAQNRSASERAVALASLLRRLESVPGVESAGIMGPQTLPFGGPGYVQRFTFFASPGYFASLRIPLLTGRFFTGADTDQSAPVAIVSESVAQRLWGHMDPIGQSISLDPDNLQSPRVTIVGVVGDIRNPLRSDTQQTIYRPLAQSDVRGGTLMVRGVGDLPSLSSSMREELRAFDPHAPEVGSLTDIVANYNLVTTQRFATWMFIALGLTGLTMAAFGVYGLMGQWVSVRIPEIGVRMALGAESSDIVKLVLARCSGPALCGLGFGAVCAFLLEKSAATQFYGVAPFDLPVMLSATVLMALVAFFAAAFPARRAAAINPGATLRNE
jgi:putative ABC transport system permease protein